MVLTTISGLVSALQGDTRWSQQRLVKMLSNFRHHELDIRNRQGVINLVKELRPSCIIHTAAQPSHDLAANIPFDDFETNAIGTLNLLEAARQYCPESPFIHMSTNKVYGDQPTTSSSRNWTRAGTRMTLPTKTASVNIFP